MAGPVLHAPWCAWRRGLDCQCGGNRNTPKPETLLCPTCFCDPCDCAKYPGPPDLEWDEAPQ